MEDHWQVEVVYTDLAKAFDSVPHSMLGRKLRKFGFHGRFYSWLGSYLAGRVQYVKIGSTLSFPVPVTSGVPQGSHLGPLLFLIFINDIKLVIRSVRFLLFADDLKLFTPVKSLADVARLESDLRAVEGWCAANGLTINIKKCQFMTISRLDSPICVNYSIGGNLIERTHAIKDLGISYDSELSFRPHIQAISAASLKTLGFVLRNTKDFSSGTLQYLYVALVRPILEFASVVWSPYKSVDSLLLERVQNKFLKYMSIREGTFSIGTFSASRMRDQVGLISLKTRRLHSDIIFVSKLIRGLLYSPELLSRFNFYIPPRPVRRFDLFRPALSRTNYCFHSPVSRMMRNTNVVDSLGVDIFHRSVSGLRGDLRRLITL